MDLGRECEREAKLLREDKIRAQKKVQVHLSNYEALISYIIECNNTLLDYEDNVKAIQSDIEALDGIKWYQLVRIFRKRKQKEALQAKLLDMNSRILDTRRRRDHNIEDINIIFSDLQSLYGILASRIAYGQRLEKASRDGGKSLERISNEEVSNFEHELYDKYMKRLQEMKEKFLVITEVIPLQC